MYSTNSPFSVGVQRAEGTRFALTGRPAQLALPAGPAVAPDLDLLWMNQRRMAQVLLWMDTFMLLQAAKCGITAHLYRQPEFVMSATARTLFRRAFLTELNSALAAFVDDGTVSLGEEIPPLI